MTAKEIMMLQERVTIVNYKAGSYPRIEQIVRTFVVGLVRNSEQLLLKVTDSTLGYDFKAVLRSGSFISLPSFLNSPSLFNTQDFFEIYE